MVPVELLQIYTCEAIYIFNRSAPAEKGVMGPKGPSSAATLSDYMTLARELQVCCHGMTKVNGAQKLERRIGTEIKFFQTVSKCIALFCCYTFTLFLNPFSYFLYFCLSSLFATLLFLFYLLHSSFTFNLSKIEQEY